MKEPIQDRLTDLSSRLNPMEPNIQPSDRATVTEAVTELYAALLRISELEQQVTFNTLSHHDSNLT